MPEVSQDWLIRYVVDSRYKTFTWGILGLEAGFSKLSVSFHKIQWLFEWAYINTTCNIISWHIYTYIYKNIYTYTKCLSISFDFIRLMQTVWEKKWFVRFVLKMTSRSHAAGEVRWCVLVMSWENMAGKPPDLEVQHHPRWNGPEKQALTCVPA